MRSGGRTTVALHGSFLLEEFRIVLLLLLSLVYFSPRNLQYYLKIKKYVESLKQKKIN